MPSKTIDYKDLGLNELIRMLGADIPKARVGVLGDRDLRKNSDSNATIGVKHEFGKEGMPIRSFLRMPLTEHLQEFLENSGAFDADLIKDVIVQRSLVDFIRRLGMVGEAVVSTAFETGGFGKWKPSNMAFKTNHQTLVETQQLRDSITSDTNGV